MESLSIGLSSPPNCPRIHKSRTPNSTSSSISSFHSPNSTHLTKKSQTLILFHSQLLTYSSNPLKHHLSILKTKSLSLLFTGFSFPLSSFASEAAAVIPTDQSSNKINLEAIVVSIDDFFNRYPFFVFGVSFIWLFVVPFTQEFFRKYKFISAIDAFRKLKEDPNAQLLDIRDRRTLKVLSSPNLKILKKNVVQVEFKDGDNEEVFVEKVKENFENPANTTVCILDNFDGESMKVAELLFNNGFKEAYAIRGGVRGEKGWQAIQETLLPPSVHIYPKKKVEKSKQVKNNGAINQQGEVDNQTSSDGKSELMDNRYSSTSMKSSFRSSSPYSMYQEMKPPSSPTPSKPHVKVETRPSSVSKGGSEQVENQYVNSSAEPNTSTNHGFRSLSPYPMYPDIKPPSSPTPSAPQK